MSLLGKAPEIKLHFAAEETERSRDLLALHVWLLAAHRSVCGCVLGGNSRRNRKERHTQGTFVPLSGFLFQVMSQHCSSLVKEKALLPYLRPALLCNKCSLFWSGLQIMGEIKKAEI